MNHSWSVEYVELGERKPLEEFILGVPVKERAKIFETITYFLQLKNDNLPIKQNLSRHLEDGIFEPRTSLRDKIARTFYFYQEDRKIVITHGFIKKTQKTPRKEMEKAKTLREQYLKRSIYD